MSYPLCADTPTHGWPLTIIGRVAWSGSSLALWMLLVGWGTLGRPAHAQQYKMDDPTKTANEAKSLRMKVINALRNSGALTNQKAIDEYFRGYLFPAMTSTDPKLLGQLSGYRDDLFKRFLREAASRPAQDYITSMTLKQMGTVALGNYHPAVRYNAVLVLGMLDQEYVGKRAGAGQPIPLPAATNALLMLLEKDEIRGVKIPMMLKSGALIGLERHARYGIDSKYADRITQASIGITQQAETPNQIDPEVHQWIKCQAGRVLARQFAAGPITAVANALAAMIADNGMSLADRCSVAAMLKDIDFQASENIDLATSIAALGSLSKDVASDEAEHAQDYRQEVLGGGAGNFRDGRIIVPRGRGGPIGPQYERRRLLDRLVSITRGIGSVQKGAAPELKSQLQQVMDLMQPVIATASEKDSIDEEIVNQVLQLAGDIKETIDRWGKSDEPASG